MTKPYRRRLDHKHASKHFNIPLLFPCRAQRSKKMAPKFTRFFSLPIETRCDIYKRVLALPQSLYLFQDPGCPIEAFVPGKPFRWLALLYVNRQISAEASAILYGRNHFVLHEVEIPLAATTRRPSLVESFLNCIGPVNAGLLSHLCVNFPATERIEGGKGGEGKQSDFGAHEIRLREESVHILHLLQKHCAGLRILETLLYGSQHSYSSALLQEDQLANKKFVRELLWDINVRFRAIASLNRIIIRVYSGSPALSVREFLQGLGWVVFVGGV